MHLEFNYQDSYIEVLETLSLDVQDVINHVREEEASERGIAYPPIADASGREDLGNGVKVGLTVELLGSWAIHFPEGNYVARIAGGNLVGGPGGDPVAYSAGVQTLLIQSAASTVVEITADGSGVGGGLTSDERTRLFATALETTSQTIKNQVLLAATQASVDELGDIVTALTTLVNTIKAQTTDLHDESFGRWVIDFEADKLTMYRPDSTVLKSFNLARVAKPQAYGGRDPV